MKLGKLIRPAKTTRAGGTPYPILSMTMRNGLVPQGAKFKKRVAGADLSQYKVVQEGQLVVGFPIDEAVLAFQRSIPAGIVSPAYAVWDISDEASIDPLYLERFLRSPVAIAYYSAKLQGSTARRRSLPNPVFLDMDVPLPSLDEQRRIAAILNQADELRAMRRQALASLDTLNASIFEATCGPVQIQGKLTSLGSLGLSFTSGKNLVATTHEHDTNRVIKVNAVSSGHFEPVESKPLPASYVPPESHRVKKGDLLFTRASGSTDLIGIAAVVKEDPGHLFLPDKIWRARISDERRLRPEYLQGVFRSPAFRAHIENSVSGAAGVKNVSQAKVLAFEVAVPSAGKQEVFAARAATIDELKRYSGMQLAQLNKLFASLQHRAFKGEL